MRSFTHPEVVSLDEDLRHDNVRITFRRHRSLRYGRHPVDELELQCERWLAQVRVLVNKMPSLQQQRLMEVTLDPIELAEISSPKLP